MSCILHLPDLICEEQHDVIGNGLVILYVLSWTVELMTVTFVVYSYNLARYVIIDATVGNLLSGLSVTG
jgi:hypothetical protein